MIEPPQANTLGSNPMERAGQAVRGNPFFAGTGSRRRLVRRSGACGECPRDRHAKPAGEELDTVAGSTRTTFDEPWRLTGCPPCLTVSSLAREPPQSSLPWAQAGGLQLAFMASKPALDSMPCPVCGTGVVGERCKSKGHGLKRANGPRRGVQATPPRHPVA
jgi:hypothetical protein